MKNVRTINEIKIGDRMTIVGASVFMDAYIGEMFRHMGETNEITFIYEDVRVGYKLGGSGLFYPRVAFDLEGDTKSLPLTSVKPGLPVIIGKELIGFDALWATRSVFTEFNINSKYHQFTGQFNPYDKHGTVLNDTVHYKYIKDREYGIDTLIGVMMEDKLLYVPHYCLFTGRPTYEPRKIDRTI